MNTAESKIVRPIKNDLAFSVLDSCGTRVFVVAHSEVKELNETRFLSCKNLLPLSNLVYDSKSDSYIVDCVDYLELATIPISIVATMRSCQGWSVKVPLPEKVIKRYLSARQKKELKSFLSNFDIKISSFYVQMLDPNV